MEKENVSEVMSSFEDFEQLVPDELRYTNDHINTLQVNIGYMCNLSCKHCHLQCSPTRTEMMDKDCLQACLDAYETGGFTSMDITGGAPEMHPDYEWFLGEVNKRGIKPMCRTNLCILKEPAYEKFMQLYADYDVTLVASMPYYSARSVDSIRGNGVFDTNIEVLKKLNALGFGTGQHTLMLVYNPNRAVLPPAQESAEKEFKEKFAHDFDIRFDTLIAIANNPSGRFANRLAEKGNLEAYMKRLTSAFNEATCKGMMCRDQISVDWQGKCYDCDFNQALGLPIESGTTIFDLANTTPEKRHIVFKNHCYGCTAGAGSSCGGATA